jgi:membrane-associated protein
MLGYLLGNVSIVRAHFEKVIFLIIFVSVLPVLMEAWKAHRAR